MNSISWNWIAHFRCDWKYNSGALERSIFPNWPFEICPTLLFLPFRNILALIWYFELDSAYQEVQFYLISDAKIEFCIIIINSLSRQTFSHKNINFFDAEIPRITWFQPIRMQIVAKVILIQNFWSTLICWVKKSYNSFPDCQGIFDPIQKVEPEIASEWYFRVQPIGQSRRFCNFCNIYLYRNRKRKDLKEVTKLRNTGHDWTNL